MNKGVERKKKPAGPKKAGLFHSLRLSSKMSILLGLCSAIALIGTGSVLIDISKRGMEKSIDSNMVDKTHMAINDIQNILYQNQVVAETIKEGISSAYETEEEVGAAPAKIWNVVDGKGDPVSAKAMGPATFQSRIRNVAIPANLYNAESSMLDALYAAVNSDDSIFGVGIYFDKDAFIPGVDDYSLYLTKENAKTRTIQTYSAGYQEEEDFKHLKETKKLSVSGIYQDAYTKDWVFSVMVPIVIKEEFKGYVLLDMKMDVFELLQQKDERFPSLAIDLADNEGNIAYSMDADTIAKPLKEIMPEEAYNALETKKEEGKSFTTVTSSADKGNVKRYIAPVEVGDSDWWVTVSLSEAEYNATLMTLVKTALLSNILGVLILVCLTHFLIRTSLAPLKKISSAGVEVAKGNFDVDIQYNKKDEIGELAESMREIMQRIRAIISDLQNKLSELSKGNYRVDMEDQEYYAGAYAPLLQSLRDIRGDLSDTMKEIKNSAAQVQAGSEQVSNAAQSLSEGATEQASSIEELSATMVDISHKIDSTLKITEEVATLSNDAEKAVNVSTDKMDEMAKAMQDITVKSQEISKIIKTIDDIAFQTNILSLNAAIEAARAGAAGKGFAVVADEVGNLAQKSAKAAQNTSSLIAEAIDAVEKGAKLSGETVQSLEVVSAQSKKINSIIGNISQASDEQAKGVKQVSVGIDQISSVVQNNSATAEESAAASEELSGQAHTLNELMSKFQLKEEE